MKQIAAGGEITVSYLPDHELIHAFAERQEVFLFAMLAVSVQFGIFKETRNCPFLGRLEYAGFRTTGCTKHHIASTFLFSMTFSYVMCSNFIHS